MFCHLHVILLKGRGLTKAFAAIRQGAQTALDKDKLTIDLKKRVSEGAPEFQYCLFVQPVSEHIFNWA